jgi:hypothetical protein
MAVDSLMDEVLVGMASIPERAQSMMSAVASLSGQCDRLVLCLNEYERPPRGLARFKNVEVLMKGDDNGGDAEKFAGVDDWDGIVVTVDDDILYPRNYVARIREGLETWGQDHAVGFHGGVTRGWNGFHVTATGKRVRCLGTLEEDDPDINVLGTGAMGFHAGRIPIWRDVFRYSNMADVHFACHARALGVPMVCLSHRERWLRDICPPVGQGRRIYDSNRNGDGSRCDTRENCDQEIRRFDWLQPPPRRPLVHVSVSTCGRPDLLRQLLDDLAREARWVDLHVCVFEDPDGVSDYQLPQRMVRRAGWEWHSFERRLGREQYWRVVDAELRRARRSSADWYLFLPDDVRLVRHAIPKAITTWYRLDDPATLTLWRLRSLEGLANWTGKTPVGGADADETFHVDGLYLCRRDALTQLGFRLERPRKLPPTGSGVGAALSRKLDGLGARMYRVHESLAVSNDGGVSVMNRRERQRHPAVTL